MEFILDNMVPDSVRKLLVRKGQSVVAVRKALRQDAPDSDIAAYAKAVGCCVVTHDGGMANRCRRGGIRHVWMRVGEPDAATRLDAAWDEIDAYLTGTALRVVVFARVIRAEAE